MSSPVDITLNEIPLLGDSGDLGILPVEAIVANVVRGFLGAIRDVVEEVPGRAGSWTFEEKAGDRSITVVIILGTDSATERRQAIEALADWADLDTPAPLIISDEADRYWDAKLAGMSDPEEVVLTATVELIFRVGPYAKALELSELLAPLELVDAVGDDFDIDDTVNAYPVVEVTAGAGGLPAGFAMSINGLNIVYGTPVAAGDTVTISSVSYTVSLGANTDADLDGSFVEADLSMLEVDGDFPVLIPGTNTITIEGGDTTVAISWRRLFRA